MTEILQQIRTPLGLAALVCLLGAPILRQVLRRQGKPNADTRAVIRYGFILGLTLGVLSIAAFVITATFVREIRISGTVRDESGAGLPFVSIRIAGRDGGITDDGGNFAFTIPDSRASDQYVAEVFRENYVLERVPLEGRYPQPISVVLKKVPVSTDNVIALPTRMIVRHNLGVPQVEIGITFTNPFPRPVTLNAISVTLVDPKATSIPMLMEALSLGPGSYLQPLPTWKLERGDSATITYSFFNANPQFLELHQKVFAEVAPKQASLTTPDPDAKFLSDALVQQLRDYMASQFVWTPGTWEIRVTANIEGQTLEAVAKFTLSDADVAKMKAIVEYYPAGLGVFPAWRFWEGAGVKPSVDVALIRQAK